MTLGFAVIFKNFQNFTGFSIFFDLKQFNRTTKLWYPAKIRAVRAVKLLLFILRYPCFVICSN